MWCYSCKSIQTLYSSLLIGSFFLAVVQSATVDLNVGAYFEFNTTNRGWNSAGVWPAVHLAAEHVNQRNDLLPGYRLKLHRKDSRCSDAFAIKALIEQLSDPLRCLVALLGPGCSIAAEPVASVAHFWNLIQVSYSAGSPRLSDRSRYPNFFRMNSDETNFNEAIVALLKHFNWSRVAVVKQDEGIFNDVNEDLQALFKKEGITLIAANSFVDNPDNVIKDLKEKDARIIISLMYEDKCRKLMCSAYKDDFYGQHLVWLLRGWYTDQWWTKWDPEVDCGADEIKQAAGHYLATEEIIFSTSSNSKTVADLTPSQLGQLYEARRQNMSERENSYAPYGYDVIWCLALALNRSIALLAKHNMTLSNFSYQSKDMLDIFYESVRDTSFNGMSGYVHFNEDGQRKHSVWIEQMQGGEEARVGVFNPLSLNISSDGMTILPNMSFRWTGGKLPTDHLIKRYDHQRISRPLFIAMVTLALMGIVMALNFLIFNIRNRAYSYIKMSSPNINNIMAVGCIMCYSCVFLFGADFLLESTQVDTHSTLCKVRLWIMSVGFTVAYGSMFVKTWRVYRIFTNTKLTKELGALRDRHLVAVLVALVFVDLVYLAVWQSLFPLTTDIKELPGYMEEGAVVVPVIWVCDCEHLSTWLGCLHAYKGLLLVLGLFLAWETRNVTLPALNDSKQIGISVYNVVLCASIAAPLELALAQHSINVSFALAGATINICTSFSLGMLFFPKIRALKVRVGALTTHSQNSHRPPSTSSCAPRTHPDCPACKCE